jgi:multidrug efflux system outer membrane protein
MVTHKDIHMHPALLLGLTVIPVLLLGGCAGSSVPLDTPEHRELLERDRAEAEQNQLIEISLPGALKRGVERNLDARVAAMEILVQEGNVTLDRLAALPGMEASYGHAGRSNDGATSSRSVLSGLQSLEPSQSTDERRRVTELSANWNLLDAALALSEAESAKDETKIAKERYSKVVQNIERDVLSAYWRALAFQNSRAQTESLLTEGAVWMEKLTQAADERLISADAASEKIARLSERQRALRDIHSRLALSETEIKGLLSLPHSAKLSLASPAASLAAAYKPLMTEEISAQEWQALQNRPEMREDILKKNIALRHIREEVFKTFPGGKLLFSYNKDSNQYLQDGDWTNFSASIVQNLLNVFTLPARYSAAKDQAALVDARRQALSAAILAQVHMARTRLATSEAVYKDASGSAKILGRRANAALAGKQAGLSSGYDAFILRIDGQIDHLRAEVAQAELQDSYAALVSALGRRISGGAL